MRNKLTQLFFKLFMTYLSFQKENFSLAAVEIALRSLKLVLTGFVKKKMFPTTSYCYLLLRRNIPRTIIWSARIAFLTSLGCILNLVLIKFFNLEFNRVENELESILWGEVNASLFVGFDNEKMNFRGNISGSRVEVNCSMKKANFVTKLRLVLALNFFHIFRMWCALNSREVLIQKPKSSMINASRRSLNAKKRLVDTKHHSMLVIDFPSRNFQYLQFGVSV